MRKRTTSEIEAAVRAIADDHTSYQAECELRDAAERLHDLQAEVARLNDIIDNMVAEA